MEKKCEKSLLTKSEVTVKEVYEWNDCLFHVFFCIILLQAITKNEDKLGISTLAKDSLKLRKYVAKLKLLSLLPALEISPTFERLTKEFLNKTRSADSQFKLKVEGFVDYYEKQWIHKVHPEDFSVYGSMHRTNNILERFNKELVKFVGKKSSTVHFLGNYRSITIFINKH